jgi:hypothetical protein
MGGVNSSGQESNRADVWWDPSDPDKSDPPLCGSIRNNGLITGTTRSLSDITAPATTIFMTLRVERLIGSSPLDRGPPGAARRPGSRSAATPVAHGGPVS